MEYISVREASLKWGISERRIQRLCLEERVAGAIRFSRVWMIPKDAEKPEDARIECDDEGEMYRLFHSVNTLVSVLNAHIENEFRTKEFLKDTISDISHQLKTPLAALNIYNGILQSETEDLPDLKEFTILSEKELDRIESLIQNLLKITRLDAGTIILEKNFENVSDMMHDIEWTEKKFTRW